MTSGNTEGIHLSSWCILAWLSSIDCWQRLNIRTDGLLILCLLIHNNRCYGGKKPPTFIVVTFLGQVTYKGIYDRVDCDKSWSHSDTFHPLFWWIIKKVLKEWWWPWKTSQPLETKWNPRKHHICGTRLIVHIESADSATWNLYLIS